MQEGRVHESEGGIKSSELLSSSPYMARCRTTLGDEHERTEYGYCELVLATPLRIHDAVSE